MTTRVSTACDDQPTASTPAIPARAAIDSADRGRQRMAVWRHRRRPDRRPRRLEPTPWIGWY